KEANICAKVERYRRRSNQPSPRALLPLLPDYRRMGERKSAMTPIGARLKEWRTERGLSLSGLALKAGIGKATLSRWEAGQTLPRLAELETVLEALGVSGARRQEALLYLDAPRALHRLREIEPDVPLSGDLLRAMRLRRGRTQAEVAAQVGISQATLAKWEA